MSGGYVPIAKPVRKQAPDLSTGLPGSRFAGDDLSGPEDPRVTAMMLNGLNLDTIPVGGADRAFAAGNAKPASHAPLAAWPPTPNTVDDTYSAPGVEQTGVSPYPGLDAPYGDPRALYPADPPEQLDPAALHRLLATLRVKTDRKAMAATGLGSVGQALNDHVRMIGRGTFGGPWADEGNAAMESALGVAPYDESLAYQNALDDQIDQEHPVESPALRVGTALGTAFLPGGQAGMLGKVAGGPGLLNGAAKSSGILGLLEGVGKSMALSSVYGLNAGAGESRGGFDERAVDGLDSATRMALYGIIPGAFGGKIRKAAGF